jgi:hypothetical protein
MRQLMRQQRTSCLGAWRVAAAGKHDVLAERERLCADRFGGVRGIGADMQPRGGEIVAEARFHLGAQLRRQACTLRGKHRLKALVAQPPLHRQCGPAPSPPAGRVQVLGCYGALGMHQRTHHGALCSPRRMLPRGRGTR